MPNLMRKSSPHNSIARQRRRDVIQLRDRNVDDKEPLRAAVIERSIAHEVAVYDHQRTGPHRRCRVADGVHVGQEELPVDFECGDRRALTRSSVVDSLHLAIRRGKIESAADSSRCGPPFPSVRQTIRCVPVVHFERSESRWKQPVATPASLARFRDA